MTGPMPRDDTDYKFTADQIAKLERGLLSLRESGRSSTEVKEAIAAVQYQEILSLRAELDAAMGFAEEPCDLVVSLSGPTIGIGVAPARAIANTLSNLRAALLQVTAYLVTGDIPRPGRLQNEIAQTCEFHFIGATAGSFRLRLSLPDSSNLDSGDDQQPAKRGLRLILETVDWIASSERIEKLGAMIEDERLMQLLLRQVQRIAPKPNSPVRRIAFASQLVAPSERCVLSYKSISRIQATINSLSERPLRATETGLMRDVDLNRGLFTLTQRPDGQNPLRCIIVEEGMERAIQFLDEGALVKVRGLLHYDDEGQPYRLRVEEIYPYDQADMKVSSLG